MKRGKTIPSECTAIIVGEKKVHTLAEQMATIKEQKASAVR